jgi:hypothetical protein
MRFVPFLERLALRRSRPGSSSIWTAVAIAAWLLRHHDKRVRRDMIVLREELQPGETLLITHTTQTQG